MNSDLKGKSTKFVRREKIRRKNLIFVTHYYFEFFAIPNFSGSSLGSRNLLFTIFKIIANKWTKMFSDGNITFKTIYDSRTMPIFESRNFRYFWNNVCGIIFSVSHKHWTLISIYIHLLCTCSIYLSAWVSDKVGNLFCHLSVINLKTPSVSLKKNKKHN